MNKIQTTARVMMAAVFAAGVQSAAGARRVSKAVEEPRAADTVVVYKTDTVYINNAAGEDGNVSELAQITNQWQLEAYKAKLLEESNKNSSENDLQSRRRQIEDDSYENRQYFNLFLSYFSLFMFGLALPCLVIFLYLNYSKKRQQRYEMLIDLMRSGVEVKPEMIDALSLNHRKWVGAMLFNKTGMVMEAENYVYCVKRVAWALACLLIGIVMASITNWGGFFGFGLVVAGVLLLQAAVRYFSLSYIAKNSENKPMQTPDNNAQQP